ncbi:MAG: hypothetical protein M1281_14905 [Chloroflexi bacterium]|nr:hypothetical protein [Chloroflexota bacterium]
MSDEIDTINAFLGEEDPAPINPEEAPVELPEGATVVTLRTSSGDTRHVPVTEAMPLSAVMERSGLALSGAVQYWLDGNQIQGDTVIPLGATVTIVGNVKGGMFA